MVAARALSSGFVDGFGDEIVDLRAVRTSRTESMHGIVFGADCGDSGAARGESDDYFIRSLRFRRVVAITNDMKPENGVSHGIETSLRD